MSQDLNEYASIISVNTKFNQKYGSLNLKQEDECTHAINKSHHIRNIFNINKQNEIDDTRFENSIVKIVLPKINNNNQFEDTSNNSKIKAENMIKSHVITDKRLTFKEDEVYHEHTINTISNNFERERDIMDAIDNGTMDYNVGMEEINVLKHDNKQIVARSDERACQIVNGQRERMDDENNRRMNTGKKAVTKDRRDEMDQRHYRNAERKSKGIETVVFDQREHGGTKTEPVKLIQNEFELWFKRYCTNSPTYLNKYLSEITLYNANNSIFHWWRREPDWYPADDEMSVIFNNTAGSSTFHNNARHHIDTVDINGVARLTRKSLVFIPQPSKHYVLHMYAKHLHGMLVTSYREFNLQCYYDFMCIVAIRMSVGGSNTYMFTELFKVQSYCKMIENFFFMEALLSKDVYVLSNLLAIVSNMTKVWNMMLLDPNDNMKLPRWSKSFEHKCLWLTRFFEKSMEVIDIDFDIDLITQCIGIFFGNNMIKTFLPYQKIEIVYKRGRFNEIVTMLENQLECKLVASNAAGWVTDRKWSDALPNRVEYNVRGRSKTLFNTSMLGFFYENGVETKLLRKLVPGAIKYRNAEMRTKITNRKIELEHHNMFVASLSSVNCVDMKKGNNRKPIIELDKPSFMQCKDGVDTYFGTCDSTNHLVKAMWDRKWSVHSEICLCEHCVNSPAFDFDSYIEARCCICICDDEDFDPVNDFDCGDCLSPTCASSNDINMFLNMVDCHIYEMEASFNDKIP